MLVNVALAQHAAALQPVQATSSSCCSMGYDRNEFTSRLIRRQRKKITSAPVALLPWRRGCTIRLMPAARRYHRDVVVPMTALRGGATEAPPQPDAGCACTVM
jgi:hypothetical protein